MTTETAVTSWDSRRRWNAPADVESLEALAEKLTDYDWTLCTAFCLPGRRYIVANVGGDWRVLVDEGGDTLRQIESITFGWCDRAKALDYLRRIAAGEFDSENYGYVKRSQFIEHGYTHERGACGHCA